MKEALLTLFGLMSVPQVQLQDALATLQVATLTCVSSTVAAGAHDQVLIGVTCGGERVMESIFPRRMNLIKAVSLVTERFAQLGMTSECKPTFHRVPFELTPRTVSVLCIHQRK